MSNRLFAKEVSNCSECPNMDKDEEEHLDTCYLTGHAIPWRGIIPETCPLPKAPAQ